MSTNDRAADSARPDDDDRFNRVFAAVFRTGSMFEVLLSVSSATGSSRWIYVEQRGSHYRWSPAHPGGPYPLLRTAAKVAGVDYRNVRLAVESVPSSVPAGFGSDGFWRGMAIVAPAEEYATPPDAWVVLEFEGEVAVGEVFRRLAEALPGWGKKDS